MLLAAAGDATNGPVLWVLSVGDLIAIAVALVANGIVLFVTVTQENWKRAQAKHDRVYGHFSRVIFAANVLVNLSGIPNWKADQYRSKEELDYLKQTSEQALRALADADATLRVEGMEEHLKPIEEMAAKFTDFRFELFAMGDPDLKQQASTHLTNLKTYADAIAALRDQVEKELPAVRAKLLPDRAISIHLSWPRRPAVAATPASPSSSGDTARIPSPPQ